MSGDGLYIYCIIETEHDRHFGSISVGILGNQVLAIGYNDIAMVVSNSPLNGEILNSQENMIAHQKVIEMVMREFTVLPVRFGTIAASANEIRGILERRYKLFKNLFREMDHKIELGVKCLWKNMAHIFTEIANEDHQIKQLKEKILKHKGKNIRQMQEQIGQLIENALQIKKETDQNKILQQLKLTTIDFKLNHTTGDEMFLNAVFLISSGREKEFDNVINDLSEEYSNRIKFIYTGPLPPYNFVNLTIELQPWEHV